MTEEGAKVDFSAEILEDGERHMVELVFLGGDRFSFKGVYDLILQFFGPYVNV